MFSIKSGDKYLEKMLTFYIILLYYFKRFNMNLFALSVLIQRSQGTQYPVQSSVQNVCDQSLFVSTGDINTERLSNVFKRCGAMC